MAQLIFEISALLFMLMILMVGICEERDEI